MDNECIAFGDISNLSDEVGYHNCQLSIVNCSKDTIIVNYQLSIVTKEESI